MRKTTFCICKTKVQISFTETAKLMRAFVFTSWIVQFHYFLNLKFSASSHLLCLYSSACVGHNKKPCCWFSHDVAHIPCVSVTPPVLNKLHVLFAPWRQTNPHEFDRYVIKD